MRIFNFDLKEKVDHHFSAEFYDSSKRSSATSKRDHHGSSADNSRNSTGRDNRYTSAALDLWLSEEAAKGALRLRDLGHWLPPPAGRPNTRLTSHISTNDRLLRDIPECNIIREERTPALINIIDQTFQVEIPAKETYQEADYEQYEITCFTEGSKTTEGVGSGLTIRASPGNENLNLEESYHHNDPCTVFQAEVYAVGKAATIILNDKKVVGKNILINCDSQSAIRAIKFNSTVIKTHTIEQTTRELNDLGRANNVLLCLPI
ncbi:hypothetical protein ACHWQZ_G001760 [Mnemiopsis leidyi]